MDCTKCGSTNYVVELDSRGLAEARCADCGSLIKKLKTSELVAYYNEKLKAVQDKSAQAGEIARDNRLPCRYCTEKYVIVRGNMRSARQYMPIEIEFCPICGRKRKPEDIAY